MSPLGKLIKVEREIWVYRNSDNKLMEEVRIEVSKEILQKILYPYEHDNDPDFYNGYILNEKQLEYLVNINNLQVKPDFKLYEYILQTHGIYDQQQIKP